MDEDSLFGNLEGGELSEEQWEQYKDLQIQSGSLVWNDFEFDDFDDEDLEYDEENTIFSVTEGASCSSVVEEGESDSDTNDSADITEREHEITNKYLNGELTFTQYSTLAENLDNENTSEETTQELADKFVEEMDLQAKGGKMRKRNKLPRDLQGLLGQANLCLAKKELDDAIKFCMEIIRLAPRAPEPFHTLGMIYDELESPEKSLQFSLIAAFLSPNDPEEWVRLAEISLTLGDPLQAVTCYTNALKSDPTNIEIHRERCTLLEQLGKTKKALEGYQHMLKYLKPEQAPEGWQFAREICKAYHEMGETQQAIITMVSVFEKFSETVSSEDINILVELFNTEKKYEDALHCFQKYGNVTLHPTQNETTTEPINKPELKSIIKCSVTDPYPIDLRVKLVIVLLHLDSEHLVDELLAPLFELKIDEIGDLYLDLAEAYMDIGRYEKAEPLLSVLVESTNYNLAAVWLRFGECLNSLMKTEEAAKAYMRVVELAPNHAEARMSLSTLLQQLGRTDEAIEVVREGVDESVQNSQMAIQCCNLLFSKGNLDEFVKVGFGVLNLVLPALVKNEEICAVLHNYSLRRRVQSLRDIQKELGMEVWVPALSVNDVNVNDLWNLFIKVCETLFTQKRFPELQHLTLRALGSRLLSKNGRQKEIEFLCLLSCYFNNNAKYGYNFAREIVVENVDCNRAWNLFSQLVCMAQDLRHNRFCLRFVFKQRENTPLLLLNGHNALVSGSYKHALGEYIEVYKSNPTDPLACLMIGLTFIHLTSQKFTAKKHTLFIQALAFLNRYLEFRGECQESLYNIGRAMHQLGLTYVAVHYYKKALHLGPCIKTENGVENYFDLSCEIAYNLALIYQNSGSDDLAAVYVNKYCVL